MIDEVVRWATPVTVFQRTALEDLEVGGVPGRKGQRVGIFYSSANITRDPTRPSGSAAMAPTTASVPTWPARRSG